MYDYDFGLVRFFWLVFGIGICAGLLMTVIIYLLWIYFFSHISVAFS